MHKHTTLPNGLRIVTGEMPHTRSATVSMYVGAGSRYELDEEAGLSHFLEHMLFKGASRRPTARDISEAIESVGGMHNAATDREITVYYAKVPHTAALETIDILADMVREPVMDAAELEKERSVILEELAGVEDSPGDIAAIMIDETLWPGQPLGRNVGGTPESVTTLPLAAVNKYFRAQYVPENMVLTVAGRHARRRAGRLVPRAWPQRCSTPCDAREANGAGAHLPCVPERFAARPRPLRRRPAEHGVGRGHVEPAVPRIARRAGARIRRAQLPERIPR
jgi:predicted Zn-dependent peptidase